MTRKLDEPRIDEVEPVEGVGRDTIARYQAQFRAAAYACLEILSGKTVNRVYCDYHDDYVTRHAVDGKSIYHFHQVKTKEKKSYLWNRTEMFGLTKKQKADAAKIAKSFAGKLVIHTVRFNKSCGNVIFLTNVHLDAELEKTALALQNKDFADAVLKAFMEKFNEAFAKGDPLDEASIKEKIGQLQFQLGLPYLHPDDDSFDALAREAIFKYSEIDLKRNESKEIIQNLVTLVEKKSSAKLIEELSESDLDDAVGVGVTDLLDILSISKGAYEELLAGGDPSAIRNASIIQRKLSQAGAGPQAIEYCSKSKVQWDIWLRDKRHTVPEFELNFLLDRLNDIAGQLTGNEIEFIGLESSIGSLFVTLTPEIAAVLSKDLLLGGVFAALVRSELQ
jgi:hypothetical protein